MNRLLPLLLFTFSLLRLNAQTNSPEIITTAGDSFKASNAQIDWTLGEISTNTVSKNGTTLTQGFQQGDYNIHILVIKETENYKISVFPNPAIDFVTLKTVDFEFNKNANIQIIDLQGRKIFETLFSNNAQTLNLSHFVAGEYILRILDSNSIIGEFKIIKI